MTFQPDLLASARTNDSTTPLPVGGQTETIHTLDRTAGAVGLVGGFGVGAPAAAIVLEELVALGVEQFLCVGTAGALQPDLAIGDVVVCDGAVRDEGISHHYAPADHPARPNERITTAFASHLAADDIEHVVGATWTCDAFFRETQPEVEHYRSQGVLTVDMEAAALFVVGTSLGVKVGSAFCVSDSLVGLEWNPSFGSDRVTANLEGLVAIAIDTLQRFELR